MKKVFTILLGMILVISMVGCVCAADLIPNHKQDNTVVSYTIGETYTVKIPDSIVLVSNNDGSVSGYGTVNATIERIDPNKLLNITINSTSYDKTNDIWNLTHSDGKDTLGYHISKDGSVSSTDGKSPVKNDEVVLSVPAAERNNLKEVQIHCKLVTAEESISHSGTYSDTLKFTVSIVEDPSTSPSSP